MSFFIFKITLHTLQVNELPKHSFGVRVWAEGHSSWAEILVGSYRTIPFESFENKGLNREYRAKASLIYVGRTGELGNNESLE